MRIAWFSPFNPRSAIGDYSAAIVRHLAKADDVTTFAAEQDDPPRDFPGTVVRMPAEPDEAFLAELDDFDYLVYNLGDCLAYHQGIYELAQRRPGVVILHDLVMADFFRGATARPTASRSCTGAGTACACGVSVWRPAATTSPTPPATKAASN